MNAVDFSFASSATFTASSGGVGVTSASIQITILDETTVENLENVNFLFAEMTAVDSVTLTSTVELRIRDDGRTHTICGIEKCVLGLVTVCNKVKLYHFCTGER